ncbi:hypothetical protein HYPSUDRAFT_206845 [Hypholoma sublateritium FD-334 SS-4]|uniref:Uncharacterized protein n=1 Tax=Hypholoma sublateritium (strain FD-334 SS-4) TaxID=945553 RepID=A0A0D2M0C2_HYPSF|nr:hypothetical protein HYPSUDRAFT_206845 [Hypholoma sublateritium FD-334 SS-4]
MPKFAARANSPGSHPHLTLQPARKTDVSDPSALNPLMELAKKRAGGDSTGGRPIKRKAFEESVRRSSVQLGPGGSCDSQTDSQTPWADDSFAASLKQDVDDDCHQGRNTADPTAEVPGKPAMLIAPAPPKPLTRRVTGPSQERLAAEVDSDAGAAVRRPLVRRVTIAPLRSYDPAIVGAAGGDAAMASGPCDAGEPDNVDDPKNEQHGSEADGGESQRDANIEEAQGFSQSRDPSGFDDESDGHTTESDSSIAQAETHETKAASRYYRKYRMARQEVNTAKQEVKRIEEAHDRLEKEAEKLREELNASQRKLADLQKGFVGLVAQFSDLK